MASLRFLSKCLVEEESLVASVGFLVQLHVDEGHLDAATALQPENKAIAVAPPRLHPEALVDQKPKASEKTPPAADLEVPCDSTLRSCGSSSSRRVAGAVPSTPYTPVMLRHHRRPHSAAIKTSLHNAPLPRADSSGALQGERSEPTSGTAAAAHDTPEQQPPQSSSSSRHQRRSEFVDRWLEKLYFRNPVIVTQKRTESQSSGQISPDLAQPPSPRSTAVAQLPARCRSADPSRGSVGQLEVIHVANVRDDDEVVAKLPPKPTGLYSHDIRHELLVERLTQCFSRPAGQGPIASRPQSPMTRPAANRRGLSQGVGISVSDSSTALPSVSTFVERKRRVLV